MKILYTLKFAFIDVISSRSKTLLTTSGIMISIMFLVFLFSLGYGLDKVITTNLESTGADKVINVSPNTSQIVKLDSASFDQIQTIPSVKSVDRKSDISGKFAYNGTYLDIVVSAVTPGYLQNIGIVTPGNTKFDYYDKESAQLIIVNQALARAYGLKSAEMKGKDVYLDFILTKNNSKEIADSGKDEKRVQLGKFKVLDVIQSGSSPFAYVPYTMANQAGASYDTGLQVVADSTLKVSEIRSKIEALGFTTDNISDSIDNVRRFFGIIRLVLVLFSLITFIVATIGLVNMLNTSMYNIKQEIAYIKLIGGSTYLMKTILTIESIYLSLIGSVVGVILGVSLGNLINLIFKIISANKQVQYFEFFSTPVSFIAILLFSSVVYGLVLGLIVSRKSDKINAILALKRS